MKRVFVLLLTVFFVFNFSTDLHALELEDNENSEPYINLEVDNTTPELGEKIQFNILFGNTGLETAENIKITFNQPLDGRSPLQYVESDPEPTSWLTSEFGNLPEYVIESLPTFEVEEERSIEIIVSVRESIAPQIITPSANLQAPKRAAGQKLIKSDTLIVNIANAENDKSERELESTTSGLEAEPKDQLISKESGLQPTPTTETESASEKNPTPIGAVLTTLLFLGFSSLVIVAFIAGRMSKRQ